MATYGGIKARRKASNIVWRRISVAKISWRKYSSANGEISEMISGEASSA